MKIIRRFRTFLRGPIGRGTTAAVIVASLYAFSDPTTYLYALEQQRAKEGEIRAIAKKLGVDPEFLLHPEGSRKFDLHSVMAWANEKLGLAQQSKPAALQPLDVHDSISQVKARYALVSADTAEARLAALVRLSRESSGARGKKKGAIKGEIESALRLLQKDLLPPLPDGLPAVAQSRHGDAKNAIETLRNLTATTVQSPTAFDDANIDTTLQQLASALSGTLDVPKAKARWTHDPFPLKDAYRTAPKKPGLSLFGTSVGSTSTLIPAATQVPQLTPARMSAPQLAVARNAVSSEVSALAATLQTPAKAFTWIHDRIDWEPYSGVAKGALGTLKESRGNDWDQALLLRDLLVAQNYQAQIFQTGSRNFRSAFRTFRLPLQKLPDGDQKFPDGDQKLPVGLHNVPIAPSETSRRRSEVSRRRSETSRRRSETSRSHSERPQGLPSLPRSTGVR